VTRSPLTLDAVLARAQAFLKHFAATFKPGQPINARLLPLHFDEHFDKCHRRAQQKLKDAKQQASSGSKASSRGKASRSPGDGDEDGEDGEEEGGAEPDGNGAAAPTPEDRGALLKATAAKGSDKSGKAKDNSRGGGSSVAGPPKKMAQVWRDDGDVLHRSGSVGKLSKGAAAGLDYSKKTAADGGPGLTVKW